MWLLGIDAEGIAYMLQVAWGCVLISLGILAVVILGIGMLIGGWLW